MSLYKKNIITILSMVKQYILAGFFSGIFRMKKSCLHHNSLFNCLFTSILTSKNS